MQPTNASPYKSRQEAIAAGSRRYNTGKPCGRGHTSDRYSLNGACLECLHPKLARPEVKGSNVLQMPFVFPVKDAQGKERGTPSPTLVRLVQAWLLANSGRIVAECEAQELRNSGLTLDQLTPTDKCMGTSLASFITAGWTPAQLVEHGYAQVAGA